MSITVKIAGVDRTDYVDARSLSIIDEVTGRACVATFDFICRDVALEPADGEAVLIEDGTVKLFAGRILSKEGDFLPPNQLKYTVECVDHTRDLDKTLVVKSYTNQKGGDIVKDIIDTYTTGFTYVNVQDGPTLTYISFDYIQVSEAITQVAEACGYQWYIDYDKDLYFFLKTDYPCLFKLDDDQKHYKDLVINTDISQLRNRVYVKSSKYETLDFTELFIGDGATVTWTCKYQANALPAPSLKLDGVAKTVGWDGVDNPDLFDFMLNASTKVLSLGTFEPTPGIGEEIVPTYGADVPIIIRWDDEDSIAAVAAIEGGDGIHEFCITDNNVDTKEWAIDLAKADLLENADPVIQGSFITNEKTIRSGQIITLDSAKRGITQNFLVQKVELIRVDTHFEYAEVPYKPAATAEIGYKPADDGEMPYREVAGGWVMYYIYEVTIATKIKGLEDLLLQLLYQSSESLKRDTTAPAVPTGLALTTGMGEITQAGLTWLKAAWNANTEVDFSHYELKYKKTAYSDFGLVSTTDTTFLWVGFEQNVEYQVYIRAVDIYGNRSAWSSVQTQTTATDTDAPAQVADQVATAIVGGIKVEWTRSLDTNVAYYLVERQESNDGTTWVAAWIERTRILGDLWLDLLLTYTKFYRYRITAYTQTGTAGVTSGVTADSIAASKTGADDIVAKCITAAQIFGLKLSAIFADMGQITAGDITLDAAGFIRSTGKTNYASNVAGFWMGYDVDAYKFNIGNATDYLKWTGAALEIKTTGALSAINVNMGTITAGSYQMSNTGYIRTVGKTSYADNTAGFWLGYSGGAYKLNIGSAANWLKWSGTALLIKGRLSVGANTNEDIYFEDSGIRMYDAESGNYKQIKWKYSTLDFAQLYYETAGALSAFILSQASKYVSLAISGSLAALGTTASYLKIAVGGTYTWRYYTDGVFRICERETAPTARIAGLVYHIDGGNNPYFHGYIGPPDNSWGRMSLDAPNW